MDTTVLITIIAGIFGLLTLAIQTYGQIQLTRLKIAQDRQAVSSEDNSKKLDNQAGKLDEVHTIVNSAQTRLIEQVVALTTELIKLKSDYRQMELLLLANKTKGSPTNDETS